MSRERSGTWPWELGPASDDSAITDFDQGGFSDGCCVVDRPPCVGARLLRRGEDRLLIYLDERDNILTAS